MSGGLALDVLPALVPSAGIGRYVRDLATALVTLPGAPPATFVAPGPQAGAARTRYGDRVRALPFGWGGLRLACVASLRFGLGMDRLYGDPGVVHSPMGYGPAFTRAKLILTIHDLTSLDHPEWHPRRVNAFMNAVLPRAARRAALILCDSEFVRGRVIERLGAPAARTLTLPLAVSPGLVAPSLEAARARVGRRFELHGPYVLNVGTIEPRKNHLTLVAAFERLRARGFSGPLVLVGREGWRCAATLDRLRRSTEHGAIRRIDSADDDDLAALYAAATVMAYPSLEEGFGYPVLEAMACGAPVVTGDHAALRALGGDAVRAVPALDADALAAAIESLWRDESSRAVLVARGRERAANHAFEPWARRMFAIYDAVARGGDAIAAARETSS